MCIDVIFFLKILKIEKFKTFIIQIFCPLQDDVVLSLAHIPWCGTTRTACFHISCGPFDGRSGDAIRIISHRLDKGSAALTLTEDSVPLLEKWLRYPTSCCRTGCWRRWRTTQPTPAPPLRTRPTPLSSSGYASCSGLPPGISSEAPESPTPSPSSSSALLSDP